MTPERWQQVREVLEKALELAPGRRSVFLDGACLTDSSLRKEVETLLASSDEVRSSFLQSSSLHMTITPGTKLGDYEVKSLLGSGGMGEVYRARDSRLGRDVAIKVLPAFASVDSERLRRFEQEARAAAALSHPNILAVHQMGSYQGAPYLVSELLEGETLREQLKRGRLAVRKAIDYGVQIARGLAAAHEKGIVHRDLKPENLFVTKDGRVKILDFGLAKLTQPQSGSDNSALTLTKGTEVGMVMGTAGYMAPEQVRGQAADHRADIFAFGAILYEILAGKRAFQKLTSAETMTAILNEDPSAISQVATNLPPALQRVVHRCLEKSPEQRFQSASDLAFALDALSDNSQTATPPRDHSPTRGMRRGLAALAMGLIFIGLLLGAILYSARKVPSESVSPVKVMHKQFTFLGNAYWPAISPDGLFVAYVTKKFGEQQKLIVQASNGSSVEIARGTVIDGPRWSPDGADVLFFRNEPELYKTEPIAKNRGISIVSRLGGVARPIAKGGYACWLTQDGNQVVTASGSEASGFKGFRVVNKVTGENKEVPLSGYTWLHDIDCSPRTGLILAVTRDAQNFQIRIFKPDGSEQRKLIEGTDEIFSARWSPTGDSIYYLHRKGSTRELSKIPVKGNLEPVAIASGLETGDFFSLSADGFRLAYTRRHGYANLWQVKLQSAAKAKAELSQLSSGTSFYTAPSFSPDGKWISFELGPNAVERNIFKMRATGGEPIQLTYFEHASTSPAWSPDGERIAFVSDQNGTPRVWTISATGGTPQQLEKTNASNTNNELAWWPSSDIVYQKPGLRNFIRVNEKTQTETEIIQHDESAGWVPGKPVFSPDGKKLAVYWNRKPEMGLWIISFQPYSEAFVLPGNIIPFGWSPDGKYVYAGEQQGEGEIIRVQATAPNGITSVAAWPGEHYDDACVSPDGHEIIVTVKEEKSDVWLMENFDPSARAQQ